MRIKKPLNHTGARFTKKTAQLFGFSVLYLLLFSGSYYLSHNTAFTIISLCMLLPITWYFGYRAGFFVLLLNTIWTQVSIGLIHPSDAHPFTPSTYLETGIFAIVITIIGLFSKQNQRLQEEFEKRKNAEEQLRLHQQHLEETIIQRTREVELTNKKVHRNEKLEAIGQLAGGVAHDFNNKLTIILGYCELLLKNLDKDSTLYKYTEQIRISGLHSSELTRQLLAFARKGIYKSQVINVHDIVTDVIALVSMDLPDTVTLTYSLKATKPMIWGGVSQIKTAILNCAMNAREAMENGGTLILETANVTINEAFRIEHDIHCKDGSYVSIKFTDTGIGISPDIRKHIFEPFFTTKCDGKGTGMGLAAVYGIIESHRGAIHVHSIPEEGSTFTLFFPLTKKRVTLTEAIIRNELYCHNEHIFLIDDEILVAETIKTLLENTGYRVSLAYSGSEAIRIYKEKYREFDIIMIDMAMPVVSGLETFRALKKINPSITAIITSGYAPNTEIEQALEEGVLGFLQKPCDRYEIHILIQKVLGARLLNTNSTSDNRYSHFR